MAHFRAASVVPSALARRRAAAALTSRRCVPSRVAVTAADAAQLRTDLRVRVTIRLATRRPPAGRDAHVKIANCNGRASLVLGDEIADLATISDGAIGPDPMSVYADWPTAGK